MIEFRVVRPRESKAACTSRFFHKILFALAIISASLLMDGELSAQSAPVVTVAKPVMREVVENDEFIGRFEAVDEVAIRARVGGYLNEIRFKDGAIVKKGDILFVIDQRPFNTALEQANSALEVAKSTLTLAEAQYKRAESLAQSGSGSISTLDDRRRDLVSAGASVRGAQAAADRAALDLEYTQIVAPISGRVDRKLFSIGSLVEADSTVLTTIVLLDPIDFYFDVDERRLLNFARTARERNADLQQGDNSVKVQVHIADAREGVFVGELNFAENRFDNATGTMRVRARFPNSAMVLQPGLFGRAQVEASNRYTAVLIPDEAISSDQNQRVVHVVAADGTVSTRPIRPGPRLYGYRVVRDGLKGEETIIINGLLRARPGVKVSPQLVELPPSYEEPAAANPMVGVAP